LAPVFGDRRLSAARGCSRGSARRDLVLLALLATAIVD
jgi:hypothetical protein